ncbi:MAG: DUF4349 domain-containing protein [bacterium]
MKIRSYLLIAFIALMSFVASCGWVNRQFGGDGGEEFMAMSDAGPDVMRPGLMRAAAPEMAPPPAPMPSAQKLMRSASLTVEVSDIGDASDEARKLVEEMGGNVANSSAYEDNAGVKSLHLTLKVPSDKLDAAIAALKKMGRVRTEDTSAIDVTEEYIDMEARLANSILLEKRLVELLSFKTNKLKDVLETEKELGRVRAEIESLQARKRYMDGRIDLATIEATFVEPQGFGRGIFQPLSGVLQKALGAFTASLAALVIVLSALIPWIAILILAGWVMIRLLKIYLKHKRQKKQNQ